MFFVCVKILLVYDRKKYSDKSGNRRKIREIHKVISCYGKRGSKTEEKSATPLYKFSQPWFAITYALSPALIIIRLQTESGSIFLICLLLCQTETAGRFFAVDRKIRSTANILFITIRVSLRKW